MDDFQKFLDESLSKVNFKDEEDGQQENPAYDIFNEISEMIVNMRKELNMTQSQLAHKTDISQANISKFEKGLTHPTLDTLKRISDAFGKRLVVEFREWEEYDEWQ